MPSPNHLPQQGFNKYLIWLVPVIALVGLVLLMRASGNGQTIAAPLQTKVQVVEVMPVSLTDQYQQTRKVVGTVEAIQNSSIGFDLSGLVNTILVDEGQQVDKDQLLAELDQQRLLAQKKELDAMLTRAQSEANLAQLSFTRIVDLVNKKLEPTQRLDEARETLSTANALVNEVIARTQTLDVELAKTQLLAPYAGTITERFIDQGAVVGVGQPLFNLQQADQLHVRFAMPAQYASNLQVGDSVNFTATNHSVQGFLQSISGKRRLDTQTIDLIAQLDEKHADLLPGDLLHFDVSRTVTSDGFWIPRTALVSGVRGLWSLFVVEQINGKTQLVAKLVELIHADVEQVFVRGALTNSDKVVITGVQRLVPGQEVHLKIIHSAKNSSVGMR